MNMKLNCFLALVVLTGLGSYNHAEAALTADIVFIVDESGSMGGEHAWLGNMITALDANLIGAGVTGNQYALVGYGGHISGQLAHTHTVGGGDFGTAAQLSTATGGLVTSGGIEDGWEAIDFALNNYAYRANAATNFILVTDEDRDNNGGNALTFAGIASSLNSNGVVLNVVVNANFQDGVFATALGIDGEGAGTNAYLADGGGGFTTSATGVIVTAFGTTEGNYIDLAFGTGGASWSLNQLRLGGLTADSFTAAFVDIKTEEIVEQVIPEPTTIVVWSTLGLMGFVRYRRRSIRT